MSKNDVHLEVQVSVDCQITTLDSVELSPPHYFDGRAYRKSRWSPDVVLKRGIARFFGLGCWVMCGPTLPFGNSSLGVKYAKGVS